MAARVGIEISRAACRIVQIKSRRHGVDTAVDAFAVTPSADAVALEPFRGRQAAVVVWGLASDHRQAVVTAGSYARMRREAVNAARQAGIDTRQMLADITRVPKATSQGRRRRVVIALARTAEVADALRLLTSGGVRVRSLVTPALALMSLSRLRRRLVAPDMAEAYVALEETSTAIALMKDGVLVAAREYDWGFQQEQGGVRPRDEVTDTLEATLKEFFDESGAQPGGVAQVCVCGGVPELRSMTFTLTERLDVEVEPLDSLFGIDADRLPSDDFRDDVSDLRLPWAVAADWNAPINLLRERRRHAVKRTLTRAAIVAGIATGVGIAWKLQQSALLEPSKASQRSPATAPGPPRPQPTTSTPGAQAPTVRTTPPLPPVETPRPASTPVAPKPAPVPAATPVAPKPAPPPAIASGPPPVVLTPVAEPSRSAPTRETQTQPSPVIAAAATPAEPAVGRPAVVRRPPPEEVPVPFEAILGTILYGAERKLAIVDGRIVQVGDEIRGARVVEITQNSVLLRDQQGRLRRLGLEQPRR